MILEFRCFASPVCRESSLLPLIMGRKMGGKHVWYVYCMYSVHKAAPCTLPVRWCSPSHPPFSQRKKLRHREVNPLAQRLCGFLPSSAGLCSFHLHCISDSGHLLFPGFQDAGRTTQHIHIQTIFTHPHSQHTNFYFTVYVCIYTYV